MTVNIEVSFKKPVPLDETIYVLGQTTKNRSRMFEGFGVILGADKKTVLAEATAKYLKQNINNILEEVHPESFNLIPDDVKEFELFYEFVRS